MQKQKILLPALALIAANTLWGMNTIFIKISLETIPPQISVSIRFLAASLILAPFALRGWIGLTNLEVLRFILSSVFTISLSALALNIGLSKTSAVSAAIIGLLGPVALLILSALFLKEKISLRTLGGILVAIAGSVIIIGEPLIGTSTADMLIGNVFIFLSVVFGAIATLLNKPLMKKTGPYQATFLNLFPGALVVAVYALISSGPWPVSSVSTNSIYALIASIAIVIIANSMFYWALKHKKAHTTGVYTYIGPAVTVIIAWLVLNERPDIDFTIGAVFILLGVCLAEMQINKRGVRT